MRAPSFDIRSAFDKTARPPKTIRPRMYRVNQLHWNALDAPRCEICITGSSNPLSFSLGLRLQPLFLLEPRSVDVFFGPASIKTQCVTYHSRRVSPYSSFVLRFSFPFCLFLLLFRTSSCVLPMRATLDQLSALTFCRSENKIRVNWHLHR